jgi:protein-S-isoprenylcysteine O-methyltransferase Ste14
VLGFARRTFADVLLLGVTVGELALLLALTPTFETQDWIYVLQHVLVLAIALTRGAPRAQDRSLPSNTAVFVAYTYPYAQVAYVRWVPTEDFWPSAGLVLVIAAACLSLASLLVLGRGFGIRPALRVLATRGPYRLVRHPMYLSYVVADIGYNLIGWNSGTVVLVLVGWVALIFRIRAEERILAQDAEWGRYVAAVRYRLLRGVW